MRKDTATMLSQKSVQESLDSGDYTPKSNLPKAKLEDFEVGARIGAGTFGVILRVVNKITQEECALKVINKAQI